MAKKIISASSELSEEVAKKIKDFEKRTRGLLTKGAKYGGKREIDRKYTKILDEEIEFVLSQDPSEEFFALLGSKMKKKSQLV